ncbi:MAG: hypothetical protein M3379_15355 [Acidobacteriota bacterium]|nr:hypothetical protein [Acidobacteriota bacterium]
MRLSSLCLLSMLIVAAFQTSALAQSTPSASAPDVRLESNRLFDEALKDRLERVSEAQAAGATSHESLERKAAERLLQIQTESNPRSLVMAEAQGGGAVPARNTSEQKALLRPERVIAEYVNLLVEKNPPPGKNPQNDPLKALTKKLFREDILSRMRARLAVQLRVSPDPEAKFVKLTEDIREQFTPANLVKMREAISAGRHDSSTDWWPACEPNCP